MKKYLKVFLILIGILVISFIALLVYEVKQDLKEERLLKQEIVNFSNKDLAKDDFSIIVKTTGNYAYIEEAIKKYYKEISDNVKNINYYLNHENLTNVLSLQNLVDDRPTYTNSHSTIDTTKTRINESINKISEMCDEDKIRSLIDKDKIDEVDYELYLDLMSTQADIEQLKETKNEMKELSSYLNELLNKVDEILNFFEENDSSWNYQNGGLYFKTESLREKYNNLYKELTEIVNRFDYHKTDDSQIPKSETI